MFRRSKSAGDEPVANQLRITAEPNVLSSGESGSSATSGSTDWEWTAAGLVAGGEEEAEIGEESADEELDGRTAAQRHADLQAELQRQAEEFGLTGDNPVGLYGPNGEAVASMLESLADIDEETAEAIADAYEAIPEAERKVAQSVVRRRHRGGKLDYELDLAERGVADWLSSLKLTDRDEAALYAVVANAAVDAVDALVLEDELADPDFATLYGAWSEVMDSDEDEEDEEDEEGEEGEAGGQNEAGDSDDAEDSEGIFGPNTDLVQQVIAKLKELSEGDVATLVAAWREQPREELRVAHRSLQNLADEDPKWRKQLRLAQEEVFAWMKDPENEADRSFSHDGNRDRELAGPALADAIAALVMADMLDAEDAAILYAPWSEVIKSPELPTYEE